MNDAEHQSPPPPIIYVDADACPVKAEAATVAERHGLVIVYVSNGGLRPSRDPMVRNVVVSKGVDAADDWIVENVRADDIVVTADVPLAARSVALGAHVMGPTGRLFTKETIGMAVAMRDLRQHLRETGEDRGYNASFSREDRSRFLSALDLATRRAIKARAEPAS
ncbi:MAG: YaiI/YqxD family protein [Rhizobiaceae bacterium]|nr:YaiI/YqxD family protein [Rhizobiaceae bacterium]